MDAIARLPAPRIHIDEEQQSRLDSISEELDRVTHAKKTVGNKVDLYIDGENAFPQLLRSLVKAKKTIDYETFLVGSNDATTRLIFETLIAKHAQAKNPVDVNFLADAAGSREFLGLKNPSLQLLRKGNIDLKVYQPIKKGSDVYDFHRDHRKTVIIDRELATREGWLGGMNTADAYFGPPSVPHRQHDVFLKIRGPAVGEMISAFSDSWTYMGGQPLEVPEEIKAVGKLPVRIVEHTPNKDTNIRDMYLALINGAQKAVYLENKYPLTDDLVSALIAAAKRGVQVNYVVSLVGPVGIATEEHFNDLLAAGVNIYQYPESTHLKGISVDGLVCALGSSNVDNDSLARDREIMAVIEDPKFAQMVERSVFLRDMVSDRQGNPVTRVVQEQHQKFVQRIFHWILWLVLHLVPDTFE